jgi:hypothetical protein
MDIQTIWTRGPHRCKSISAQSKGDGHYYWNFDEQKRQPMMLNCTLYKKDPKDIQKEQKEGKYKSSYQSKPCKITIKHVVDNGAKTRTIGEITVDLADYAVDKVNSQDFEQQVDGTKNIEAKLSFTLHSRPLAGASANSTDTVSTMEGMDQSYVDTDSVADFGNSAKVGKKKAIGLDSESDEDDDLEDPDAVMGGFGAAGKKATKEAKKANPFASASSGSDDDDDDDDLGGFSKNKTTTTTTTSSSIKATPQKGPGPGTSAVNSILGGASMREKYDHSPEVSRNSRPSKLTSPYKSTTGGSQADKDRIKQLESQVIKSDYAREQYDERIQRLQNEIKKEKERSHSIEQELNLHDRNTKEIVDGIVLEWSTKVAELHVETKALKSRLNELEIQHEQRLRDAVTQADEESKRLLQVSQEESTQLKREVEQLRGRKLAFDEVLETIRMHYSKHKLPDELKALSLQIKYYDRQLVEADLTIDCVRNTYQSTNSVLMAEVRSLEEAKQQMKAALSEAAHTNNQLHQHNVVLETQCKKHSESRIKMSEILNSMEVLLSEKEEKLTHLQTENDELRLELLKLKKQLHRFQQGE